jgi:hypothetical protein
MALAMRRRRAGRWRIELHAKAAAAETIGEPHIVQFVDTERNVMSEFDMAKRV